MPVGSRSVGTSFRARAGRVRAYGCPEARGFRRRSPSARDAWAMLVARFSLERVPAEANHGRRPGRLKRGSAYRSVTAGRSVPRRHFTFKFTLSSRFCCVTRRASHTQLRRAGGVSMWFFKR